MITQAQIKRFAPRAKPAIVKAIIDNWSAAEAAGINTPAIVSEFFVQIGVESARLTKTEENLRYTTTAALRRAWPSRFKSDASAKPYLRNPQKLAIKVYGGRMGNAPAPSTDGWDYRGGGLMQTTGRAGYRSMGFEDNPAGLREPAQAFLTAVREWKARGLSALAKAKKYTALRVKINGGKNGLAEATALRPAAIAAFADFVPGNLPKAAPKPPRRPLDLSSERPADVIAIEEARDAPAPGAIPTLPEFQIIALKNELKAKGYYEIGFVDADWGSRSIAGMSAFQFENGLPRSGLPDEETMAFINEHGVPQRKIAAERASATVESLKENGTLPPALKEAEKSKFWTALQGFGAAITALVVGVLDYLGAAWDMVAEYKEEILSYGVLALLASVAVLAGIQYYRAKRTETKAIAAIRSGADTGP